MHEVISFGDALDDDADPHCYLVDFIKREYSIVHQLEHEVGGACSWGRCGSGDVFQTRHDAGVDPIDLHDGAAPGRRYEKPRGSVGSPRGILAVGGNKLRVSITAAGRIRHALHAEIKNDASKEALQFTNNKPRGTTRAAGPVWPGWHAANSNICHSRARCPVGISSTSSTLASIQ